MTKWEHKVVADPNQKTFESKLNSLGAEGWEVCGYAASPAHGGFSAVLKREAQPNDMGNYVNNLLGS